MLEEVKPGHDYPIQQELKLEIPIPAIFKLFESARCVSLGVEAVGQVISRILVCRVESHGLAEQVGRLRDVVFSFQRVHGGSLFPPELN